MRACGRKTEKSNADVGPADFHAIVIGQICRFAPEISSILARAVYVDPACSRPATLALVVLYWRYHIYAPLFYLSLLKHRIDDDDDDDRKTMTMLAPELAEGSPFRDMSAADLLEEIHKGLGLLQGGLWKRNSELGKELKSLERRKRFWTIALCVALVVVNLAIVVGAKAAITAGIVAEKAAATALIVSVAAVNLLGAFSMLGVCSLLGVTDDDRESLLGNKNAVWLMILGTLLAPLLPRELEQIRTRLLNLNIERCALRTAVASEHQVDLGGGVHLEREEEEKKKKKEEEIRKEMKRIRKTVNRVQCEAKEAAADFAKTIAN